jgi:hypothetical protein
MVIRLNRDTYETGAIVDNIPVNAAAIKTVAMASVLFIALH